MRLSGPPNAKTQRSGCFSAGFAAAPSASALPCDAPFSVHATGRDGSVRMEFGGPLWPSAACSHAAMSFGLAGAGSGKASCALIRCCAIGSFSTARWFNQIPAIPKIRPRTAPQSPIHPWVLRIQRTIAIRRWLARRWVASDARVDTNAATPAEELEAVFNADLRFDPWTQTGRAMHVVPLVGIELTTYRLQGGCSTN